MSDSTGPAMSYSLETIYGVLQHRRRRLVVHHLREADGGVTSLDAVRRAVLNWERRSDEVAVPSDHDRQVAVALHHVHLPKLEEHGVIEYDWRSKTIRYRPGETLEAHLDLAAERDFDE